MGGHLEGLVAHVFVEAAEERCGAGGGEGHGEEVEAAKGIALRQEFALRSAVQEGHAAGRVVLQHAHVQEAHRRVSLQHQPRPLLRSRVDIHIRYASLPSKI